MGVKLKLHKRWISLLLFLMYLGCIFLYGQQSPKKYIAFNTIDSIIVDGVADEVSWNRANWSDLFIDIEGIEKPTYDTKVKMLWDENHLYFFAELKEPHVWGDLKQKDTVIFYNNDFEIFIDPNGDTHDYYEFEVNALNTIWDLYLSKPYRNQANVLGGWDFKGLLSAVNIKGTLNDPTDIDEGWTVEIAIPWSFDAATIGKAKAPENEYWRINFSRVNWDFDLKNGKYYRKKDKDTGKFLREYNWVWSPQHVINMHEPERWGYVFFSTAKVGTEGIDFDVPKDEYIKWYLYELYRGLISRDNNEKAVWETTKKEHFKPSRTFFRETVSPHFETYTNGFSLWVKSPFTKKILLINEDGKFQSYAE